MNEKSIKKIIIISVIIIICSCTLLGTGIGIGYRIATKSTDGRITETIGNLKSDISTLKSEKEQLTNERDRLISELSISNGKLESIATELKRCGEDYAQQSVDYSKRIEGSNLSVLEYNRIYVKGVLELCETMERTINTIAKTCGYTDTKTE